MAVNIRQGDSGEWVTYLQQLLNYQGIPVRKMDGEFGVVTHEQVLQFQQSRGLKADGFVGRTTWEALGLVEDGAAAKSGGTGSPAPERESRAAAAIEQFRTACPTLASLASYPDGEEGARQFLAAWGINLDLLMALEAGAEDRVLAIVSSLG
jgi:peptidoglycan hydrolase-like protein with peptidoglycan-binding domain